MTSSTDGPLVSVVLPTRDRARTLGRAIDSVLAQSYAPVELIVVDDGSSDDTAAVLNRYAGDITVLELDAQGVYPARNLGVRHARGELVAFLDSDDVWLPDRLTAQVPLMQHPDVGLVFGDAVHVGADRRWLRRGPRTCFQTTPPRRGSIAPHLVWGNCIPTITVLARRTCLEEAGLFPTSHATSADYVMWLRIARRHQMEFVPEILAEYTVHDGGISWDLGAALASRVELFSAELVGTTDPQTQRLLRRLLSTLALGLVLAVLRGKAKRSDRPLRTAYRALRLATPADLLWSSAAILRSRVARAWRTTPDYRTEATT